MGTGALVATFSGRILKVKNVLYKNKLTNLDFHYHKIAFLQTAALPGTNLPLLLLYTFSACGGICTSSSMPGLTAYFPVLT